MTEPIKPALEKEEWEQWIRDGMLICHRLAISVRNRKPDPAGGVQHATAALALYGQSFGFTREDVTYLREVATAIDRAVTFGDLLIELKALESERGWSLADRIEALLPPEKE